MIKNPRSFFFNCSLLAFLLLVFSGTCLARDKKDVLIFKNGDRITCEIVKLAKGYLFIKLPYGDGTVSIDWTKIARIESPQYFVLGDQQGVRYTGKLEGVSDAKSDEVLEVKVAGDSTNIIVPGNQIVDIEQTDMTFWQNLHGSVDAGLNYTKQQNRSQYSLNSELIFARAKWGASGSYDSAFSGGGDASSYRNDLLLNGTRQLKSPRNFILGLVEFQHNTEQELALRTTVGGAFGHNFKRTNNSLISAYAGMNLNNERYFQDVVTTENGNSAEVIVGSQLNFFRFKTTNILVDSRVYPSLTDLGRVRFDLNTSLKLKIAKDLYWNLSYYLNFDSRPPQSSPSTDYGSTATLGWTF